MSVRVVARVRPHHKSELEKDIIVSTTSDSESHFVKIPNPKSESETFSFEFSQVFGQLSTQQEVFDTEISPIVRHLFNGFDVTVFAYGSTGTGKTHTMRGGKSLADRGVIPRLLSSAYRKARKLMKDSEGATSVDISLSYYEIYNDKVFDLFEAPQNRSSAGLPLRECGGKTVVVGLTERPCESLKEFEKLYDEANVNRSTSATKLNAASSRSHAILQLKLSIGTGHQVRTSVASAIDLAGSEDNRRTENGKERMVESASINRSLFTLAKCVEAISRGDERIPYRESKMTRILSLGQNAGLTIMILNLAPVRSFHLDTLSSLNFANRTKKIEVREIENEPVFKGCSRAPRSVTGPMVQRQPLRSLASTTYNAGVLGPRATAKDRQSKPFSVYSDRGQQSNKAIRTCQPVQARKSSPMKRALDPLSSCALRPAKRRMPNCTSIKSQPRMSQQAIEEMIERKVTDILAARALDQPSIAPQPEIGEEVQRRLNMLEKRIDDKDDGREQGLTFLLMARQHAVRGEDTSALRMYKLAKDFFPDNAKLDMKIKRLQNKMCQNKEAQGHDDNPAGPSPTLISKRWKKKAQDDEDYENVAGDENQQDSDSSDELGRKAKPKKRPYISTNGNVDKRSPRSQQLLDIVNSGDIRQIRMLKGVGAKKAEAIVEALVTRQKDGEGQGERILCLRDLRELSQLRGVGLKAVENMRAGLE